MAGMPSARGVEWKGNGESHSNFQRGFDNIPRNPDGTMIVDPAHDPVVDDEPKYPKSCSECNIREAVFEQDAEDMQEGLKPRPVCPDAYGNQSPECKERFEKYGKV
jgi:hypothetical protein